VKELVKLNFHKNAEGKLIDLRSLTSNGQNLTVIFVVVILCLFTDQYHCPVTFKVFNNNSHIVAVKTTGNVFSYDVG